MPFTVALIGRPNVGKSTLFNRLAGKRLALADDVAGTTRDRREGKASLGDLEFTVIDTAGLEEAKPGTLSARMTQQTGEAVKDADAALFMVDGRAGITPADRHFAQWLRRQKKPVILVVNKAESGKVSVTIAEANALGFGEPVAISAEHGEGMGELYEALQKKFAAASGQRLENNDDQSPAASRQPLSITILGRPNVGKSTLMNRILGEERVLTGPEAGITRDAIAAEFEFDGKKIRLVDTAGLRKKSNITAKVEKLAVADALEALKYAEVAVVTLDANEPLEAQDNHIAALIEQEGRALVIALNKWDAAEEKPARLKALEQRLEKVLPQVKGVSVVPVSGRTGYNIPKLLKECLRAHSVWNKEISTARLNRWLARALEIHTPPLVKGRRIKIRYMTQKSARPPTFILFANTGDIPESYLRYLVNSMRDCFDLPGTPIRIRIRKGNNPYAEKD